ncbi:MAG: inositol monophosphatase, partial [Chloroflexi bacterium]|nr:inositol monophosphatase [Chloroflexota bacterium]
IDIYFHRRIYPWDIAAAMLLVHEAGGEMTNVKGNPATVWDSSIIACGDPEKHADMVAALRKPLT